MIASQLPAEVEAHLDLPRGERILALAQSPDERWCVGTQAALYLFTSGAWSRLPWEQIERADWDGDTRLLKVVEVADFGQPEPTTVFELDGAARFLDLLRERVTKSIAIRLFAPVYGRKGLSVIGRRSPTGTGDITWSFVLSAGLDPHDPQVAAVADRALENARSELAGL